MVCYILQVVYGLYSCIFLFFRKLLLELSEDITDKEFETLRFYLDGKVKKKKLQDKKNMLELFIFLEREGLISHMDPDPLIVLLKTIKRVDLIDLVKEYFGKICFHIFL